MFFSSTKKRRWASGPQTEWLEWVLFSPRSRNLQVSVHGRSETKTVNIRCDIFACCNLAREMKRKQKYCSCCTTKACHVCHKAPYIPSGRNGKKCRRIRPLVCDLDLKQHCTATVKVTPRHSSALPAAAALAFGSWWWCEILGTHDFLPVAETFFSSLRLALLCLWDFWSSSKMCFVSTFGVKEYAAAGLLSDEASPATLLMPNKLQSTSNGAPDLGGCGGCILAHATQHATRHAIRRKCEKKTQLFF